jgi:hypothetical protein
LCQCGYFDAGFLHQDFHDLILAFFGKILRVLHCYLLAAQYVNREEVSAYSAGSRIPAVYIG